MKILIMGATGRCGQQIAHKALANGHEITVFVRNATNLSPEIASKVRIVAGSLMDENLLCSAVHNQGAIISALGPNGPGNKTWNDTYHGVFPSFYSLLLRVMRECDVRRIFAMTTISVYDERDRRSMVRAVLTRAVWAIGMPAYREFVEIANTFQTKGQDLDWTVYRIGVITDAELVAPKAGYIGERNSGLQISRKAMAAWLVEQVEASPQHWVREMPYIWSA